MEDFIELALSAKTGDQGALVKLHDYYIDKLYEYYWKITTNRLPMDQVKEIISSIRMGVTVDYLYAFMYVTSSVCNESIDKFKTDIDLQYILDRIDGVILLTNGTGQFTFAEYLKVHYNGFQLVGIPNSRSCYDNVVNGCPFEFIAHDGSHLRYVLGNRTMSNHLKGKYLSIVNSDDDNKNLLLMIIWMFIHENGFKESFYRKVHPFAYKDQFNGLSMSLSSEFRKYTPIILSDDNVDETLKNLALHIKHYGKEYVILKKYQLNGYLDDKSINDYVIFLLGLNYGYQRLFNDR
jgi:hypothetical protein